MTSVEAKEKAREARRLSCRLRLDGGFVPEPARRNAIVTDARARQGVFRVDWRAGGIGTMVNDRDRLPTQIAGPHQCVLDSKEVLGYELAIAQSDTEMWHARAVMLSQEEEIVVLRSQLANAVRALEMRNAHDAVERNRKDKDR